MRVGVLTSWRVPCGVYQYSARLVEALARIDGVEPVVLAGRADDHRSVPEEWDGEVHDLARIGLWRDDGQYWLEYETIHGLALDVIHTQYQSMLFNQDALRDMATAYRGFVSHPVYAITFHDNCQRPDFPYDAFDLKFTHRWNVGPADAEVIPFGIEDRPPIVRSFGLGRNQDDVIHQLCARNGWVFESAASHEPIHGGGQAWRTHEQLIAWLRGADAIVLWYPDHDQAGSSQSARTAMATRRPVFTNDTKWFEDLPPKVEGGGGLIYRKVPTLDELDAALGFHFWRQYVAAGTWDSVARHLLDRYTAVRTPA